MLDSFPRAAARLPPVAARGAIGVVITITAPAVTLDGGAVQLVCEAPQMTHGFGVRGNRHHIV